MDGWRRPNHMRSHLDALQTMPSVDLRRFPGAFHSFTQQALFRVAIRVDYRGFGKPKWMPKSTFEALFFNVFFECTFVSIFARFLEARNLENYNFASTGARFSQNRRFQKILKN